MWARIFDALQASLDLLLPPACLLCGQRLDPDGKDPSLCDDCLASMSSLGEAYCRRCAQPYPVPYPTDHLCGNCLRQPPPYSRVCAVGRYQGGISEAIHRLKYRNQLSLAAPLGRRLAISLLATDAAFRPDLLIPVPLHPRRLRQRGYNQAMELARPVSRLYATPIDALLLQRTRHTPHQQGLTAAERRRNLRSAFSLTRPVEGRTVLLIDDVMTTGETVRECARTLVAGGATEVRVAVVARV